MDVSNVNWKFSKKFEKTKETKFETDLVNVGWCNFHKLYNAFKEG